MVLELVAGRLIARHLGESLYTWTSVIGVVLAGITIGNYLGGRIADRFNARKTLAVLFGVCSLACVIVVVLNNLVTEWIFLWKLSWPLRVFSHVCLVFLLPSILLGAISPVVAKMALDQGLPTGRTVGDIYAWGAAGSITGTLLSGFCLITVFGTINIIWAIAIILMVVGILFWKRQWVLYFGLLLISGALVLGAGPWEQARKTGILLALRKERKSNILYEDETQYCYVVVRQLSKDPDIREFVQDKLKHSETVMDDPNDLRYLFTKIFAGIIHHFSKDKRQFSTMNIGGGGYVLPQYIERYWPNSRNDVVEIDPGVTEAAMHAFGLKRDTRINTIAMDARNYVDGLVAKKHSGDEVVTYDFICEDAFNDYSVPYQLTTKEFHDNIFEILSDNGIYMANLVDIYESGLFLGAYISTLEKTFPYVYVATNMIPPKYIRRTFLIVASKHEFDLPTVMAEYDNNLELWYLTETDINHLKNKTHEIVLTDDYAPVENMLTPVVRKSANETLAHKYIKQAEDFKRQGLWQQSILKFEKALQLNSSMSIKAYNEIAIIHVAQGNLEKAAQAFQNAIDYQKQVGPEENITATIHFNLGILLGKMDKTQQAEQHLRKAAELFRAELVENPDDTLLWTRLGNTLAEMGDFEAASEAFRKAIALDPENTPYYDKLVKALEYQGRYDEAIEVLQKQIQLMKQHGDNSSATRLQKDIELLQFKKSKQGK